MKLIKWLLWVVLFLAVIAIGGAIFLVIKVDPNDLKPQISQQVESLTGRHLELGGDLSWRFYPWVGVTINDFALRNREGFTPENMLQAAQVDVQIKLLPLFNKQLEIGKINLQEPKINLSINAQGETNWDDLVDVGSAPTSEEPEQAAGVMLGGLVIQGVDISQGDINWDDQTTGQHYRLSDFNISTGAIEPSVPIDFDMGTGVSGTDLPADTGVKLKGSLLLNDAMDSLALNELETRVSMGKLAAKLEISSLDFSISSGRLTIENIQGDVSDEGMAGRLNINTLNFAIDSGLLDIDKISGEISIDQIAADIDIDTLSFALESQTATLNKLAYSGQYELYPIQGELADVRFDVGTNTLAVARQMVSTKYSDVPIQMSTDNLRLDINQETLEIPVLAITLEDARISANITASQLMGDVQATGHLASNEFNPKALLGKLGIDALSDMPGQAMQSLSLDVNFKGGLSAVELEKLKVGLDQSTITGQFSISNFENPAYRFDLKLDQINVDDYLSEDNQAAAQETGPAAAVALPFSELKGLDVKGEIGIGELRMLDLLSNDVIVKVDAGADRIEVSPLSARVYGGETVNSLVYDISGDLPGVEISSELLSLDLGAFLQAMQITDRFEGVGSVTANITSAGQDVDGAISNLNGQINIQLNDGAIRGVNLQKSLIKAEATIKQFSGKDLGMSADLGDKTEFSEFGSDILITQGVMNIQNFKLMAPAIRVLGGGQVNLNTEQLDLRLDVSIVGSFEGQGGASLDKLKGQIIPMKITGALDSPSILPDFSKILQNELKRKLSEKYLGSETLSEESLNDTLNKKLNEKLAEEFGLPTSKQATAESGVEPDASATESPDPAKATPEPQDPEEQLKQRLKQEEQKLKKKLLNKLFGG
jgi:AsmA protein